MKLLRETWIDPTGFNFTKPATTRLEEYLRYCMVQMDRQGYIPCDWLYCTNGSIRHEDSCSMEESKFIPLDKFDEDGDYGIVECGKCGELIPRCEAFLDNDKVYLCNDCKEESNESLANTSS